MPPEAQLLPSGALVEHPEFAQNHSKLLERNSGCGGFKCAVVYCYHKLTLACSVYMLHFFRLKQEAARQKTSSLSNYAISMCFSCCKLAEKKKKKSYSLLAPKICNICRLCSQNHHLPQKRWILGTSSVFPVMAFNWDASI